MKEARLQKSCTDEQEPHTEAGVCTDKVARHTKVQYLPITRLRRCGSDRMKVNTLTRGGLTDYVLIIVRSQQRP